MTFKKTLKSIFLKIAAALGFKLSEKIDIKNNYCELGFNPTSIGANVITNIAVDDSDIIIDGENARAEAIRNISEYYADNIQNIAAEVSLGTGDCIMRPYTDGEHIGISVIGNDNFMVTESIGDYIKGVIIKLDEYETHDGLFRLFESQTLKQIETDRICYIKRFAYKDDNEVSMSSTRWADMITDEAIASEQLLLGRIKCPTINRGDYNSTEGVPITFGCDDIIEQIKNKYKQYNDEFDRKEAVTFIDRSLLRREKGIDGNVRYKMGGHEFINVRKDIDGGVSSMIDNYSPDIRNDSFKAGEDFNLSILELCCGFSRGIFTTPETSFATATEMKNSLKKTFAFVKQFRRRIESGNKMLFRAIDIIMNVNNITPMGEWDIRHDWSYDYIEQTQEKFNQLLQAHSIGAVKTEDVTAWVLGMSRDEAEEYVSEIAAEEPETEIIDDDGTGGANE